ncbi:meprin A subunit beta-like [Centropristis striata]|uniref:meprin A subunit beta-like n=1 Tax=Centropristis striata TaxID=184440 RepID=UPI0027DFFE4D|nr:meprin A subunit beta-like [Centropristis striata]
MSRHAKVQFQRSAITNEDILWTFPIPYSLNKGLEMNAKGVILRAMDQFRLKSCIDFKPVNSEDYFLHIQKLGGCYSYIGRVIGGGQDVSIGRYCDEISTVEHEFLHALGFYHEQSRYDRDEFVKIAFENVIKGRENNFRIVDKESSTTQGVPYDYYSVMHYGKNAFSNGNGTTIVTKDPMFQDVIGQRLEMSPRDVKELNLLYKCNSTVAFMLHCSFSSKDMDHFKSCSKSGMNWLMLTTTTAGPKTDHTGLPTGGPAPRNHDHSGSYFMHASTAKGMMGDSAWLETQEMSPNRDCHVQCLQFYYYNSGSVSDQLNIWIREFHGEWDTTGTLRLAGQITGRRTSHWQLQHVSLNATKHFQVVFEVRKGPGKSSGGFSIDDINLSETECPHVTMQFDNFVELVKTSAFGHNIYSDRHYSSGGYAYAVGISLYRSYVGLFVQLLSGQYDDELEWPVPHRQVTFQMLDQTANLQMQMSKQRSIVSDRTNTSNGKFLWGNPHDTGSPYVDVNNETIFAGPLIGKRYFAYMEEIGYDHFLKGGSAIFTFSFQDLTPLVDGHVLPCPRVPPVETAHPTKHHNHGPCSGRTSTTHHPKTHHPTTHHPKTHHPTTHHPTTRPMVKTTDDDRY